MKRRNFLKASTLLPFLPVPALGKALDQQARTDQSKRTAALQGGQRDFFYKPENAWAADFIPMYAQGAFQLFFLLDFRNRETQGEGTPWYRVSTRDFVHFTEHGEMLPRGTKDQQDLYVFTGSAIQARGQYHIFYTGHNPYKRELGLPEQGIMHAVSDDMKKWEKHPDQVFFAPEQDYEKHDWRDPFVFWNEEENAYNMLLAARFKKGIPRRRGLTARCSSTDLVNWKVMEPFYTPDLYYTHECPDLFKMGDWWYLLFSEFTDEVRTRYRMSRSLKGPWIAPESDDFDGQAFYAAKTASDGHQRYLFGWNPTRDGSTDHGSWEWGGNLVVHEVIQDENGLLKVRVPQSVKSAFDKPLQQEFTTTFGSVDIIKDGLVLNAPGTYCAALSGVMPPVCKIEATIRAEKGTRECGLILRGSDDLEKAYFIRLEPDKGRVVFDMLPRNRDEVTQMVELERPCSIPVDTPVHIQVFMDGNKGVVYFNDQLAMNFRAYDLPEGRWGIFASGGQAAFSRLQISTR